MRLSPLPKFLIASLAVVAAVLSGQALFSLRAGADGQDSLPFRHFQIIDPGEDEQTIIQKASRVVPSRRQLRWQARELAAFIHFGLNTFSDREHGDGTDSPSLFQPTAFNPRQWARVLKEAGFRMIILTAKHHDGFCLWPTRTTEYSVRASS